MNSLLRQTRYLSRLLQQRAPTSSLSPLLLLQTHPSTLTTMRHFATAGSPANRMKMPSNPFGNMGGGGGPGGSGGQAPGSAWVAPDAAVPGDALGKCCFCVFFSALVFASTFEKNFGLFV
jgi:hypothetical protein